MGHLNLTADTPEAARAVAAQAAAILGAAPSAMLLAGVERASIRAAAECLAAGQLLGLPTETVYGPARADDDAAVGGIFAAKGRPADHPLIVHVLDAEAAVPFAAELPESARRLMAAFGLGR